MSYFRSINTYYEKEAEQESALSQPWPASYRQALPQVDPEDFSLQIRIENQIPKSMNRKQLLALPTFTESRRITSRAGWTYYGQWKGLTFQTLFTLFSTPHLYPWVRLESWNEETYLISRQQVMNYRIILECDGKPISPLHGGPLLMHCFDYYMEYSIPHLKGIILLQEEHTYTHPNQPLGYSLEDARVKPGAYYAIHHEKVSQL